MEALAHIQIINYGCLRHIPTVIYRGCSLADDYGVSSYVMLMHGICTVRMVGLPMVLCDLHVRMSDLS